MKKFIVVALSLMALPSFAQPELGSCDQEVDEVVQNQIPRALSNWKKGNYREAERYLRKAVMLNDSFADGLYLLGDLYVKKMDLQRAEALWTRLLEVCPDYKAEVNYFLGSIYLSNEKFDKAIGLFETFLKDPNRDYGYDPEVKEALSEARTKKNLLGDPIDFNPKPVQRISSMEDEYLASISPDQQTMYFTRRTKKINRRDGPAAKVRMVEEFSKAERKESGEFTQGDALPDPFNSGYNEGGPSVTADNTELYFTVCEDIKGYKNCDIFYSEKDGYGYWSTPKSIGDNVNQRHTWESQPSVSANGDVLYFTSNREGGIGGLDLYSVQRTEDGSWSNPENLGSVINTKENEKAPFIHSDSQTLYFASDGHTGLGGYDIYYATRTSDTAWAQPQNLGYPINDKEDELGLFVSLDGRTGYFASNKFSKANGWDIYSFSLPEKLRPEEVTLITGQLVAENGEQIDEASVKLKNLETNEVTELDVDEQTGSYAHVVRNDKKQDLILTVKQKGMAFTSKHVKVLGEPKVIKAPLDLKELEVGKEYKLNDINFASNSYELDAIAKGVIDEFILYLKENPELEADIQGHTDDVGDDQDNLMLSRNRAETVYEYAVNNGIAASRLSHHGYGETKPIATNDTEEGRARNRRTVFVVTSK